MAPKGTAAAAMTAARRMRSTPKSSFLFIPSSSVPASSAGQAGTVAVKLHTTQERPIARIVTQRFPAPVVLHVDEAGVMYIECTFQLDQRGVAIVQRGEHCGQRGWRDEALACTPTQV